MNYKGCYFRIWKNGYELEGEVSSIDGNVLTNDTTSCTVQIVIRCFERYFDVIIATKIKETSVGCYISFKTLETVKSIINKYGLMATG